MFLYLVSGSFISVTQGRNLRVIPGACDRYRSVLHCILNLFSSHHHHFYHPGPGRHRLSPGLLHQSSKWPLCSLPLSLPTVCSVQDNENHLLKMKGHVTLLFRICHQLPSSHRVIAEVFQWPIGFLCQDSHMLLFCGTSQKERLKGVPFKLCQIPLSISPKDTSSTLSIPHWPELRWQYVALREAWTFSLLFQMATYLNKNSILLFLGEEQHGYLGGIRSLCHIE